jgi:large subunit ribosomal protein L1
MGKTKTAVIGGVPGETKTGKEAYEEKKKKQTEKLAKEVKDKKQVTKIGLKGGERIKIVGGEELPEKTEPEVTKEEIKHLKKTKVRSKKYTEARAKVDINKLYKLSDAVKLVKETSYTSFDGTVELHLTVKKAGYSVKAELPYPSGKKKKVEVADDNTIEKLKLGKITFDVLLATPDMMPKLVPFAKLLGPKGLMPNPKAGTLIKDKSEADGKNSAKSVLIKTEKGFPIIHTTVGKVSQKDVELTKNIVAIIDALGKNMIIKGVISGTMGPSVKLEISSLNEDSRAKEQ